jgi:hypothetical protein
MNEVWENYLLFIIPLIMWFVAQFLKFIIYSIKHGIDWKYLFEYGHMPSSHTACMTALFFTAGYYEGMHSSAFAISLIVGIIVIADAVKLRGYIGDYGKTLNKILHDEDMKMKNHYPILKERVGHTLGEVFSGALVGIVGSFLLIQIFNLFI